MRKLLVVVDMQKDFVDGALGSAEAVAIVPKVVGKIAEYAPENIFVTRDTHQPDYMNTQEGHNLPVEHCIEGTEGWELDKKVAEARTKGIAEAEKKKGRKLTDEEIAKLDAEIKKKMAELEAMKKGMKLAITIEFKDDKNLVMKQDTKISDEALKAAGYGWLKRKAMKAALAVVPKSHKGTYVVKGNMIIMTDTDNDKDTLNISQDGKYITGKLDKKDRPFKLLRIK